MRIIGIDPGLRHTGWGVVEFKNSSLIHIGNGSISPSVNLQDGERLLLIKSQLSEIVENYSPTNSAVEQIFVGSGPGSSLKLGMARGVSMVVLAEAGLEIKEIPSKLVKKTINFNRCIIYHIFIYINIFQYSLHIVSSFFESN